MIIDIISKQKSSSAYIRSFGNYLHQSHDTPDYLVREKELAAMIEREISLLSPQLKTVFELSRNEHLSHREIAEKLGLTEQTVRGYIKNALTTLKLKFGAFFLFVERKSVVSGKSVSVRVDLGGRRIIKKKKTE